MLNPGLPIPDDAPSHIVGLEIPDGGINVGADQVYANIRAAIRRPIAQLSQQPTKRDVAILVGGGPTLNETLDELREAYFAGGKIVALNGAYSWCLQHNLRPSAHIVMDAQAHNARFVERVVPTCNYFFASQCHPDLWDRVQDRPNVWMFHAGCADEPIKSELDAHFDGNWFNVTGGTTVASRALFLLRLLGFLRFEFFGIDCCVFDTHHAYPQPENDREQLVTVRFERPDGTSRQFRGSPWHFKQCMDFVRIVSVDGGLFKIAVHGRGLLAYALQQDGWTAEVVNAPSLALQGA